MVRLQSMLTRNLASGALQVSPPFEIDQADIEVLGRGIADALEDAGATRTRASSSGLLPDITSDEGVDAYDDRHYLEQLVWQLQQLFINVRQPAANTLLN